MTTKTQRGYRGQAEPATEAKPQGCPAKPDARPPGSRINGPGRSNPGVAGAFLPVPAETEAVARQVVDSAVCVHRPLGPGLLESVHETCLVHELKKRGLSLRQQAAIPVNYGGVRIASGFRLDLVVDNRVIVEVKAVEKVIPLFEDQLPTYLELTGLRLGLLVNFNVPLVKDGIKRIIT